MIKIVDIILRKADEKFDDYAKRLYRNKIAYGLTNKSIGDILNTESSQDFDESTYRRRYEYYGRAYEEGYQDGYKDGAEMDDDEKHIYIEELEKETEKHYKAKVQLQDKLREIRGQYRVEARADNLKEQLLDTVSDTWREFPSPYLENTNFRINQNDRVGILQLSDWHFGEEFEDGLNIYNMEVCRHRVEQLTDQVIEYVIEEDVEKLIVLNLGDLIAGNIRVSARVMNETDVITQTTEVSRILTLMLTKIQSETGIKITFYSVLDNHSRVNANYNQHIEAESFARVIPWYLKASLKDNSSINVVGTKVDGIEEYDIGSFKLYDSDFLFVHGHNDRLNSVIPDISMMTGIRPTSIFMGHLHSNIEKEEFGIDLIVNPSLVGVGAYAKTIRKSSKARQKLNIYVKGKDGKAKREKMILLEVD